MVFQVTVSGAQAFSVLFFRALWRVTGKQTFCVRLKLMRLFKLCRIVQGCQIQSSPRFSGAHLTSRLTESRRLYKHLSCNCRQTDRHQEQLLVSRKKCCGRWGETWKPNCRFLRHWITQKCNSSYLYIPSWFPETRKYHQTHKLQSPLTKITFSM